MCPIYDQESMTAFLEKNNAKNIAIKTVHISGHYVQ